MPERAPLKAAADGDRVPSVLGLNSSLCGCGPAKDGGSGARSRRGRRRGSEFARLPEAALSTGALDGNTDNWGLGRLGLDQ